MRRPLLLSACSAALLLLVSTATGQEQEEDVASSAADINPIKEDVSTTEEDEKKFGDAGSYGVPLFKRARPRTQREAESQMIMNSPPAPASSTGELGFGGNPKDALARVRELMSRLSTFLPAPAPMSPVRDATPVVLGEQFAAQAFVPTGQEFATLAPPDTEQDGVSAEVHPEKFHPGVTDKRKSAVTDAAGKPHELGEISSTSPAPAGTLHSGEEGILQGGSLQGPRMRGAAVGWQGRLPKDALVDSATGPILDASGVPAMEPMFAITGTENLTDAAVLATYTALMRILDAVAALRRWTDQMLANLGKAAETMIKDSEGRIEEGELTKAAQLETKQGRSEKQETHPVPWLDSRA